MAKNPNSSVEKELDKVQEQFKTFDDNVKSLTMDRMNATPKPDVEPQTKLAQSEIAKSKEIYLKPYKTVGSKEKFNENYREQYNHDKEYVHIIAENKEIIGEDIEMWTKPFAGLPAEMWKIPVNKPLWAPRYVAEQLKRKFYHKLVMQNTSTGVDGVAQYYGTMAVDTTVPRLDAHPVSERKSIFMGARVFG